MRYPPRFDPDFDYKPWLSGLDDVIEEKITEALTEMESLEKRREDMYVSITQSRIRKKITDFSVEWLSYLNEAIFLDWHIHRRWLEYWLRVYGRALNKPSPEVRGFVSSVEFDEKIKIAKERLIEDYYVGELKKAGSRLRGNCPFHEEKTPSFFVFDGTRFKCFGCGAFGSTIDYVMRAHQINFKEAVELLQ